MNNRIFVFGSNLAGRHGKGAALHARTHCGAQYGKGVGRTGMAYAIPTKGFRMETLPLHRIKRAVEDFIAYADQHPELRFQVTPIGTGLAGYSHDEIRPMFAHAPTNCDLPEEWGSALPPHDGATTNLHDPQGVISEPKGNSEMQGRLPRNSTDAEGTE